MFRQRSALGYLDNSLCYDIRVHCVHCVHFGSCKYHILVIMEESPYTEEILEFISKEFPHLENITYLDHAGASLYAKSQIDAVHDALTQNLLCNPHTNFGNLQVTSS